MPSSRDLTVRIDADVSKLERGFKSAEQSAKVFERELKKIEKTAQDSAADVAHVGRMRERHEKQVAAEVERSAARQAQAMQGVGLAASVAGAAIAVGLGKAVSASMDFEKGLSGLRAATGAGADAMEALRTSALKVGEDTSFSAKQAVEAQTALAKAGVSTADILGGALAGAASLAAAGELEMGAAAEVAATAMTQFKLAGQDVPHIADLLAAGAGKAQGEVSDLAQALNQSGLVAAQTGLTIEETAGGLSAFAAAGLLGSDAGTSFKTMLQRLNPQSDEAATLMDELGLRAYDSQGAFVGLSEYAGQLQAALGGMTAEQRNATMNTLFGSDAVRAAAVLYEQGAVGVESWETAVADAGYASRTAATMTDNLAGDLERLGGSLESALIENGSAANGVLRALVQTADGAVGAFSDLPDPVQKVATGATALTGAVSLAAGAFLLGAPKVAAFKASLDDMGPRSQRFGRGILGAGAILGGPWGLALAGGVTALGLFARAKAEAKAEVDAFTEAITADSGAVGENARQTAVAALEKRGLLEAAETLGVSLKTVTDAALGDRAALDQLRSVARQYNDAALEMANSTNTSSGMLDENAAAAGIAAGEARSLVGDVEDLAGATQEGVAAARRNAEALGDQGEAATGAAGATDTAAGAQHELTKATDAAVTALQEQAEALRAQYDPVFAMQQAVRGHADAQAALKTAIKEHGSSSQEAADAQFALLEATVGLTAASGGLSAAMAAGTVSAEQAGAQLHQWVEQGLLTQEQADAAATSLGLLRDRATELTGTPANLNVNTSRIDPAKAQVDGLYASVRALDRANGTPTVNANTQPALDTVNRLLSYIGKSNGTITVSARALEPRGDGPGRAGGPVRRRVEQLMASTSSALRVTSTYRTPEQNRAAGGSPTSYHLDRSNPAVDVAGPTSALDALYSRARAMGGWRELLWRVPGHMDHLHAAAAGGLITGPGTGTSDSILGLSAGGVPTARVSNGEFVQREAAVDKYGLGFMHAVNSLSLNKAAAHEAMGSLGRASLPTYRAPSGRFASGGLVRPLPAGMSLSATSSSFDAATDVRALQEQWA
jgi:TP901 family phage tail tape measure protein